MAVAKGKLRRTEIQHDADLEGKLTKKVATVKRPKSELEIPSKVDGGSLRGVVVESMCRVYEELWPGMTTHDERGIPDIEISEEGYILVLTMKVGSEDDKPRKGLKIREVEISDQASYCAEHAA
jgi:hypothetical protein